jgi:hypothetical protein
MGGGGAAIQQPYLRVVGLLEESEGARGDPHFSDSEHTEFKVGHSAHSGLTALGPRAP